MLILSKKLGQSNLQQNEIQTWALCSMFGKYWHSVLAVTNDDTAVYQAVNVVGVFNPDGTNDPDVVSSVTGHVFVAKTPKQFTYDDDGNLLSDGRWSYTWDAENRLVAMQTLSGLPTNLPVVRIEFDYDYMSRRVRKTVWEWDAASNGWQEVSVSAFLYDGWLVISEESASGGNITTNFYVWGLDLSDSLQGAGGVGGLLAARLGTNNVVYSYDGNGNVSELTDASTGSVKAHYEYSPFGETIVATGLLASDNPFRFSTKYTDDETGLVYYGYRYYAPGMGRWLSRDLLGEAGFIVLSRREPKAFSQYEYVCCNNTLLNRYDKLGLHTCAVTKITNCMGFPVTIDLISDAETCVALCRRWHECKWAGRITLGDLVEMGYTVPPSADLDQVVCDSLETDGRREFDITCVK